MIWSAYATLGNNMWTERTMDKEYLSFQDEAWDAFLAEAQRTGINMIFLDLGEGVQWLTHPEISIKGAWNRARIKKEVLRLREMGIELIPKMNFSACHHLWLGEYRKMMSTSIYYTVVRDLIHEAYEMFLHPRYIHVGMDEEGSQTQFNSYFGIVNYRKGDIFWHDLDYILECVKETGATPWIWADAAMNSFEEFDQKIGNENIVLNTWWYHAIRKEHFTKIEDDPNAASQRDRFPGQYIGRVYIEDGVFEWTDTVEKLIANHYDLVACVSYCYNSAYGALDTLELFKGYNTDHLLGYMTAPWKHTVTSNNELIKKDLDIFYKAKQLHYPDEI